MKKYVTSQKECQSKLGGRVCSQCGRPVEPIETVDNSDNPTFWAGCKHCQKFDCGVEPEIQKAARLLVDEHHYVAYGHLERPNGEDEIYEEYWRDTQTGGASDIIQKVLSCLNKVKDGEQNKKALAV